MKTATTYKDLSNEHGIFWPKRCMYIVVRGDSKVL